MNEWEWMRERDCCQQISYESRERSFAAVSNSIAVISLDSTDIDPIYLRQVKMKLYFSLSEIEKNIFQVWEHFLLKPRWQTLGKIDNLQIYMFRN